MKRPRDDRPGRTKRWSESLIDAKISLKPTLPGAIPSFFDE